MIGFIIFRGFSTVFGNNQYRQEAIHSNTWRVIEQCHAYAVFAAKAVRLEIR